jgi:four helix bundle protein
VLDPIKLASRRRFATVLRGLRPLASLTGPPRAGFGGAAFARNARAREDIMLRIYTTIIGVLRMLRPAIARIEAHDRDLARQLKRASASIALNASEGSGCSGGTRRERYRNALGSARETGACLDVAIALGYVEEVDAALLDALDRVRATLAKNVM